MTDEIVSPDLGFDVTPGFPDGGSYHGWESVGRDFVGPFVAESVSFAAVADAFDATRSRLR